LRMSPRSYRDSHRRLDTYDTCWIASCGRESSFEVAGADRPSAEIADFAGNVRDIRNISRLPFR
jgi:hypothetical protein